MCILGYFKKIKAQQERQQRRINALDTLQDKIEILLKSTNEKNLNEAYIKNCSKLIELMNASIRLEQAEERFVVNQKSAILGLFASIFASGGIAALLINHFITK